MCTAVGRVTVFRMICQEVSIKQWISFTHVPSPLQRLTLCILAHRRHWAVFPDWLQFRSVPVLCRLRMVHSAANPNCHLRKVNRILFNCFFVYGICRAKIESRKTKVQSYYFDMKLQAAYWGIGVDKRKYVPNNEGVVNIQTVFRCSVSGITAHRRWVACTPWEKHSL